MTLPTYFTSKTANHKTSFCYKLCDRLSYGSAVRGKPNRDSSLTILVRKKDQLKTLTALLSPYKQHKTGSVQQLQQQQNFNHSVLATHKSLSPIHVSPHSVGKYQDILTEL